MVAKYCFNAEMTIRNNVCKLSWLFPANILTKILEFRGFDSSIILISRGRIIKSIGNFPEGLNQRILVGITLVGRLGVSRESPPRRARSLSSTCRGKTGSWRSATSAAGCLPSDDHRRAYGQFLSIQVLIVLPGPWALNYCMHTSLGFRRSI